MWAMSGLAGTTSTGRSWRSTAVMATPTASSRAMRPSSSRWRSTTAAKSNASRPAPTRRSCSARSSSPPAAAVTVDMLVSGAFTGWSGDRGTFEHWLRPALNWFRASRPRPGRADHGQEWDDFIEPIPDLLFPKPAYGVHSAALGPGGGAACRRREGGGRLGLRSRPERLLLAARRDLGRRRARARWATPRSAGASISGSTRFASGTGRSSTGSRNTRSTACPNGKRRRSTRRR